MKVKLSKAVKMFFGNSSLEMVYFEAIANALDAGATNIHININAKNYSQPETLTLEIVDNGLGFTDERFNKFSRLFDVDESTHKGLGRLVYLCYFEKVSISSIFNERYRRTFEFSDNFDGESKVELNTRKEDSGTIIKLSNYTLSKLKQYSFVQPKHIKEKIITKFYSRLYKLKQEGQQTEINISATIDNITAKENISTNQFPQLESLEVKNPFLLFSNMELNFRIESVEMEKSKIITAISIDNRTYPIEIINEENLPLGYKMVFLLYSDSFNGKVDPSREEIEIQELELIKKIFKDEISKILKEQLPQISKQNEEKKARLVNKFPHLAGLFEIEEIGFSSQNEILKKAQDRFFKSQREILGAHHLNEEQFKKSLDLSARALTEYILFRQIIVNKLKEINHQNLESEIHNLIVPIREQLKGSELENDLYINNIWILDDKYMTYETILSDEEMTKVIDIITEGEVIEKDSDRPDISLVFSGNPNNEFQMVDVVIIELKKKGLSSEYNSIVEIQLENRARKLMKYYNNRIQRIWFYGVVDFNEEFELHLESEYHKLYSHGKIYYKPKEVVLQREPRISFPMGIYMLDFNAVVDDADSRNLTFLNIIKKSFKTE